MAGWHHQCNGHELGQTLGDEEGRGVNEQVTTVGNQGSTLLGPMEDCRRLDLKSAHPRGKEGHVKGCFLGVKELTRRKEALINPLRSLPGPSPLAAKRL